MITEKNLENFIKDANEIIKEIASNYNFDVSIEKEDNLTTKEFTLKIIGALKKETKTKIGIEENFKINCWKYGLKPNDLGKTFCNTSGVFFKLIGSNSKSKTYPIIAKNVETGKLYKFSNIDIALQKGIAIKENFCKKK